ncbi:MAG: hypothetical protein H7330_02925, partial [Hymenobacteraceae bacterium]|nr:hypothetical protein [Hymenobacteraceae bacterium]
NRYRFWGTSYDADGNLLTLRRTGQVAAATRTAPAQVAELDNLRYTYQAGANRLTHVDDFALVAPAGTARALRPDVQDRLTAAASAIELTYDAAGSATRVSVEGLTALSYNHLALNQRVTFAPGDSLVYRWAADGQKLGAVRYVGGVVKQRTAYVGGGAWVYEQDSLRYWRTSEGRALWQPTNAAHPVAYEYAIADHLGNVRVSFRPGEPVVSRAGMSLLDPARRQETRAFDSLSINCQCSPPA